MRVSRGVFHFHSERVNIVETGVDESVVEQPVPVLRGQPLYVERGVVRAGEVGDHRAGRPRHVRHQGELLARRTFVLPGEGFQPDPVVAVGLWNVRPE